MAERDAVLVDGQTGTVDLVALAGGGERRPAWSARIADLNLNLIILEAGSGIDEHVNEAVDVLILVVRGSGTVEIDGHCHDVAAGQLLVISKGRRRALRAGPDGFAYLTCHRRREGLQPSAPRHGRQP
ncbi:MAG TPA: cupin domain-containing protein [Chloroflexota bacterium]|nr:cupin domain-containing protein [Chloroflexota bacterium]